MHSLIRNHIKNYAFVSETDIDDLMALAQEVEFIEGEFLCTNGNPTNYIYFIYDGIIREYFPASPKAKHIVRIFSGYGPYTPSLADFLKDRPALFCSQALTSFSALRWEKVSFLNFYDKHPIFYKVFFEGVIRAVDSKDYERKMESELSATERYLELIDRNPQFLQVLSVQDIASYLGVRRETISRIRSKVRNGKFY